MDQILGSTSSLHRAARLMRSESSMPTASSCDAMRFLRGRTVHMDPTWIPMKGSKLEEKLLPWLNPQVWVPDSSEVSWTHRCQITCLTVVTRQTFDPPTPPDLFTEQPTHDYTLPTFENMYVSVTCHKLTTHHSNVATSSHMSTGTVLSSIVLLAYSFYILQRSPTIKHGHLKSRNLSSKGGGHCALRILCLQSRDA